MTTTSFPVVGDNIDHAQWRAYFAGLDGIFDSDASAADRERLGLVLSATDDTATVKRGRVHVKGFALQVTANHGLTLAAAVGSPVTYAIGVLYDPALEGDANGPLALSAQVKASLTIPSGGVFFSLYEVTRQPSQVLSQAAVVDLRRYVGPAMWLPDSFPLTGFGFPVGTHAWRAGQHLIRIPDAAGTGTEWFNATKADWQAVTLPGSVEADGTAPAFCKINGVVHFRGAWKKADNSQFGPGGGTGGSYSLGTVPAGFRPGNNVSFAVDHAFDSTATGARVLVSTAGVITGQVGPKATAAADSGFTSRIRAEGVIYPAEG